MLCLHLSNDLKQKEEIAAKSSPACQENQLTSLVKPYNDYRRNEGRYVRLIPEKT
jgi:hypothetical protein